MIISILSDMKIFFVDDSNITIDKRFEFFIYGGIIVDEKDIFKLVSFLHDLKEEERIKQIRPIKWDNANWRKEGTLSVEKHRRIKENILQFVGKSSCKIIIYLAPHLFYSKINKKKLPRIQYTIDYEKQIKSFKFATNVCLQRFNSFLKGTKSFGIIFADEFSGKLNTELKEHCFKLCPRGTEVSGLKQVAYPIIYVDSEYSAIHQINDVVLGAIQYSLKEFTENFIPIIKNNFWIWNKRIFEYGINIYPKEPGTVEMERKLKIITEKFKRLMK